MYRSALVLMVWATIATPEPSEPLSDSRLSVNTRLREDIFAGLMRDDMERFVKRGKNIEILLKQRPAEKALLIS